MTSYLYMTEVYQPLEAHYSYTFRVCLNCSDCCPSCVLNQSGEEVPEEVILEAHEMTDGWRVTCETCGKTRVRHLHVDRAKQREFP